MHKQNSSLYFKYRTFMEKVLIYGIVMNYQATVHKKLVTSDLKCGELVKHICDVSNQSKQIYCLVLSNYRAVFLDLDQQCKVFEFKLTDIRQIQFFDQIKYDQLICTVDGNRFHLNTKNQKDSLKIWTYLEIGRNIRKHQIITPKKVKQLTAMVLLKQTGALRFGEFEVELGLGFG